MIVSGESYEYTPKYEWLGPEKKKRMIGSGEEKRTHYNNREKLKKENIRIFRKKTTLVFTSTWN